MAFEQYTPPGVTIETATGPITLRGLNADDLTGLIQRHGELLELWFEGELAPVETLTKAPALVADMIACAAGEPSEVDKAAALPLGLQIRAITEVFRLTFTEADLGNLSRLLEHAHEQPASRMTANPVI